VTRIERYTPYGEPGDGVMDQGPGYTGHVTDALTGLSYAQQRYYDPLLGRFLSPVILPLFLGHPDRRFNIAIRGGTDDEEESRDRTQAQGV
jgi:RHS repeat-associated protein